MALELELNGKPFASGLAEGLFGGMRFTDKGTLSLPGAGKTGE